MGMFSFWKKQTEDPDSAWKQQNREQSENPVYRYVNLQKGGKLVEVYIEEGPEAVEQLIQEEIEPFLYGHGKGRNITKADYARWRNKGGSKKHDGTNQPTDEEALANYQEDEFNTIEEHEVCWDLTKRGAVGETALHLCVLHDTPVHNDVAKILLRLYPKLALDFYETEEYYGESALHLAIVYGDFEMVKLLVENGTNVNQRATGRFFLPEDQKKGRRRVTTYTGYAYYGEYPLAFAACFGHEEIYDYLIDHGADPNLKDSFGNSVLHMMVIANQISMYGYAVKHHVKKADMEVHNTARLTPLTLASKLGRNEIFKEIIELQSMEIWRFSNIACSKYPLAPLDTIGENGKTNWSAALSYITDGETEEHLEMLDGGVIKQLLDEKWKTYAQRRFFERLVIAVFHLLLLSLAIYLRPDDEVDIIGPTDTRSIVRYIAEIVVCLDCVTNLIFQLEEARSQGILGFLKNQASAPAKSIFNISCVLILLCVPCRMLGIAGAEMILLSLAAPCAWSFLLFFARGFVLSGVFVTVFYQMLRGDLYRFGMIYCIFLLGFTPGFYFLFKDIENENITTFSTIPGTIMQLFQMTLGEFKYEDFSQTRIPVLTKAVFAVFAILVPILLLNMLIAMMGNTYQQIISRSEKEWRRQWAKIIIVLERTFSPKQLLKYQAEYSVEQGNGHPGLMVIKASRKTKARQRKGAIANWKRLTNEIKALIKDQKKQGKSSTIDLTSSEISEKVTERQMRKRRSTLMRSGHFKGDDDDDDLHTDGLISAMTQLAWDQVRSAGIQENPREAESSTNSSAGDRTPLLRSTEGLKTAPYRAGEGVDNPIPVTDEVDGMTPLSREMEMKEIKVTASGNKVTPSGNTAQRTNKVVPVNPAKKPPIKSTAKDDKNKKDAGKTDVDKGNKKPLSSRSASTGSKESKDSAFSEERTRRAHLAMTGSRSSLNSASSLTSLLHAWDSSKHKNKKEQGDF